MHAPPACPSPSVPLQGSTFTDARKRSYKRALRRAALHPEQRTQYRGRPYTLRQLRSRYVGVNAEVEVQSRAKLPVLVRRPDRLLVWSWNAGGLTTELWQELLLTLEQMPTMQRPQVVMLQESHWTEALSPKFQTSAWTVLTSPTTDCKAAGLVMLIDQQVHQRGSLTYADPLPGRIQHARVATAHWTVDLLNVYQKPQNAQKGQVQANRELRKKVWQTLRHQLSRVPERHTVILGGDHNCHLRPSVCAGPQAGRGHTGSVPDQHLFQKLLEDLRLLQVNSWTRKAGSTYIHPTGSSQIDHLIGRQSQVDNLAKQARPIQVALAAWRQGGKHLPIAGTFRMLNFQSLNRPPGAARSWDHWSLVQKCQAWWDPQVEHLRTLVANNLSQVRTVEDLDRMLVAQACVAFPAAPKPQRLALWQTPVMQGGLRAMWDAYRRWKRPSGRGLTCLFQAWRNFQLFRQKHKAFKQAGKEARKQWFVNRLAELQTAAKSQDTRRLYAEIRSLAPKSKRSAFQLRDADGCLQDASAQADQLHQHYAKLYAAPDPHSLPSPPQSITMQVTHEEVLAAIQRLPIHKAAPLGMASTSLWRSCADLLAPVLATCTTNASTVPQLWRDAWITLVPKIPRPLEPRNLRPIGLTDVGGRAIARILQTRLKPHISSYLNSIPQFAYLAHRSTSHAILRAQSHCRRVQQQCSAPVRKIMDAYENKPKSQLHYGGIQLSLDLTSAFDILSWELLSRSMAEAQIPDDLRDWVSSWYSGVRYFINHLGWEKCVHASQGVRQGCMLAPLLWGLCTGCLLASLQTVVDPAWVLHSVTCYADDFHASDQVTKYSELERAAARLGSLLDILADAQMCINQKKSAALLRVRGTFAKRWLRQHQVVRPSGPHLQLRTPKGRLFEFPLKDHHVYLGVEISYTSAAQQTVAYRMQAASSTWQRLRKILCSRAQLDVRERLAIWRATVVPTLAYGLAASSPDLRDIQRMQHLLTRHIRAITRQFAHLSKVSTQDLYKRHRIPTLLDILHKEAHQLHKQLQHNTCYGDTVDDLHLCAIRDFAANLQVWKAQQWDASPASAPYPADAEAPFLCYQCGCSYSTYRLLRVHESKVHSQKAPKTDQVKFDRQLHSTGGVPTCRLCGHAFRQWDNLKQHVKRSRCPKLRTPAHETQVCANVVATGLPGDGLGEDNTASTSQPASRTVPDLHVPLIRRPEVLQKLQARQWVDLASDAVIQQYLFHHCPVCFQWCADAVGLKHHLAHAHASWLETKAEAQHLLKAFRRAIVLPCRPGMSPFSLEQMDLSQEEALFFGQGDNPAVPPPSKRPRPENSPGSSMPQTTKGKGKGKKGKGKGKTQPLPPTWDYTNGSESWDSPWPQARGASQHQHHPEATDYCYHHMQNLTKLVLQQEQMITSLRQDVVLYLFVKTGQGSIVPLLHQTAEQWRHMKESSPETLTYSLKLAMFKKLLIELHGRLATVAKTQAELDKAKQLNWVDERGHWRVLKWNPLKSELQVDDSKTTVPTEDLLRQTVELRKGVTEEALHRFRSHKRMTENPTAEWVQFRMEISLRRLGDPIWHTLQGWVGQAAWHLLGCRLRRERPQYNGLADLVRQ
ncbi:Pol, partial [Symbiodinium sp. CCMP2456]